MGGTAVWTAAHYRLLLLIVVANNAFFYNNVVHQERIAAQRQRPARNSWIGQAITDPDPDLPAMARSLGFQAADQVRDRAALAAALAAAAAAARSGQCVLVDVRVRPDGYAARNGWPSAAQNKAASRPRRRIRGGNLDGGRRTEPLAAEPRLVDGELAARIRGQPGHGQPRDEHRYRRIPRCERASQAAWPPQAGRAGWRSTDPQMRRRQEQRRRPDRDSPRSSPHQLRASTSVRLTSGTQHRHRRTPDRRGRPGQPGPRRERPVGHGVGPCFGPRPRGSRSLVKAAGWSSRR